MQRHEIHTHRVLLLPNHLKNFSSTLATAHACGSPIGVASPMAPWSPWPVLERHARLLLKKLPLTEKCLIGEARLARLPVRLARRQLEFKVFSLV
jgi:hypothetical protein